MKLRIEKQWRKTKIGSLKKMNKIDKVLARQTKKKQDSNY